MDTLIETKLVFEFGGVYFQIGRSCQLDLRTVLQNRRKKLFDDNVLFLSSGSGTGESTRDVF